MIVQSKSNPTSIVDGDSLRAVMESLPLYFYLTGSRYFGTQTQSSDYDYIVVDSSQSMAFLTRIAALPVEYQNSPYEVYARYDVHFIVIPQDCLPTLLATQEWIKKYGLITHDKARNGKLFRAISAILDKDL